MAKSIIGAKIATMVDADGLIMKARTVLIQKKKSADESGTKDSDM